MDLQLADKTVLVTGAGQGLGQAIGLAFAQRGRPGRLPLQLLGRRRGEGRGRGQRGGRRHGRRRSQADLRDDAAVEQAPRAGREQRSARSAILVNNAAATQRQRFLDSTPADWRAQVDVTVTGMLRVTHGVRPADGRTGRGIDRQPAR